MKKLYFIILGIIVLNLSGFSQNWEILNSNRIYNYTHSDSAFITHTIWIDSTGLSGSDSCYYLNTIASHCDTCTDTTYYLAYQPQFLQRQMIKYADSSLSFTDTATFILKPFATLGQNWVFDNTNNINANISAIYADSIFGFADTVKTIMLSNGDSILISKLFGIIHFPDFYGGGYYTLSGIDNENIGERVPGFYEIFDFNIGDIFQYEHYSYAGGVKMSSTTNTEKHTILSKQIMNDTIRYEIERLGYYVLSNNIGTYPTQYYSEITFKDYINIPSAYYPDFGYSSPSAYYCNFYNQKMIFWDSPHYTISRFNIDTMGIFTKECGIFYDYWYLGGSGAYYNLNGNILIPNGPEVFHLSYKESLGMTDYRLYWFEGATHVTMLGYVKGTDTVGTVYSDAIMTGINLNKSIANINIYPNPTTGKITIQAEGIIGIEVMDITGKTIFNTVIASKAKPACPVGRQSDNNNEIATGYRPRNDEIDLSNQSKGIYIIKVQTNKGVAVKKVVLE